MPNNRRRIVLLTVLCVGMFVLFALLLSHTPFCAIDRAEAQGSACETQELTIQAQNRQIRELQIRNAAQVLVLLQMQATIDAVGWVTIR